MYAVLEKFCKALKACPISNRKHKEVLDVTPIVYDTTPEKDRGPRDQVVAYLVEHWKEFTLPDFKTFMAENIELILDVVKAMKRYKAACKRCKEIDKWKADHVACGCGWGERC